MRFYQVGNTAYYDDRKGYRFFGTLEAAKTESQEAAQTTGNSTDVYRVSMQLTRDAVIAFGNDCGWCDSKELVYTAKPRRRTQ